MKVNTEDFASLLVAILGALPPEGKFCKVVASLAQSDAWADYMDANYSSDGGWEDDKVALLSELKAKFGDEIDMPEVIDEWNKQAG